MKVVKLQHCIFNGVNRGVVVEEHEKDTWKCWEVTAFCQKSHTWDDGVDGNDGPKEDPVYFVQLPGDSEVRVYSFEELSDAQDERDLRLKEDAEVKAKFGV